MGAAVEERAALKIAHQRGHDAGNRAQRCAGRRPARHRNTAQQPLRVGVAGRGEEFRHRSFLDDLARIHHRHLPRDARDHAQVMGDQHHGDAELGLQVGQQPQDLRLDGDVQRGAGLVGDQQLGPAHERHRDHHALAQPARQLVRILGQPLPRRGDADFFKQLHGPVARLLRACLAVVDVVFGQLFADGVGGVQGRHGLLEDHGHLAAAQGIDASPACGGQVFSQHRQPARAALRGLGQQAHDGQRGHGLAAARFPDEAQRFAAPDLEGHVAHRVQGAARRGDVDSEALHVQDDVVVGHGQALSSGVRS
ncbi:hypothetical protein FQZ97_780680 [compost metagenome]